MIEVTALIVVALVGVYLIGLASMAVIRPARAAAFLGGFARSAPVHWAELGTRLLAGGAMLVCADRLLWSGFYTVSGWVLVGTTAGLALFPWRWHRRVAQATVPHATRYMPLLAAASGLMGAVILASVLLGTWRR
jgi:hypothetical protein